MNSILANAPDLVPPVEILALARGGWWAIGLGTTVLVLRAAPAAIAQLRGLLWDRRTGRLIESAAADIARTTDPQQRMAHWQMLAQLSLGYRPGAPDAEAVTTAPPPAALPPGAGPPAHPAALPPADPPDVPG
ncbi:hypothetical protein [Kitasatospora sp. NPDC005751]|uniref:hypothetical protein n=1 Tax=Kitasatospora sp. NPDC005751 TaxID=3157064 RepID=UPI0033DA4147